MLPRGYAATTLILRNRQSLKQEEYSYRQMLKPFKQFFSWPCRKNHPKQTKIREKKRGKKVCMLKQFSDCSLQNNQDPNNILVW